MPKPKPMPQDFANRPIISPAEFDNAYLPAGSDPDVRHRAHTIAIAIYASLAEILDRDDGWLRVIPSRDRSPIYAKWKFTSGEHDGKYVMVVVQYYQLDELFPQLLGQLHKVDRGALKPTLDKYFSLD